MTRFFPPALLALPLLVALAAPAAAQVHDFEPPRRFESPETFSWELRVGMYQPSVLAEVAEMTDEPLSSDRGPMIATELDWLALRIPYFGTLGPGVRFGWARYTGPALLDPEGDPTGEEDNLNLFPLSALGVLRIDVLARELGVPLIFTGKIGFDAIFWRNTKGGQREGSDIAMGLVWGAQVALELDFLERRAARALDEEWGINHTFVFFELFGSTAKRDGIQMGADLAWAAGLGFVF